MQRGPPAEDGHSHPSEEQRGGARAARMERGGDGPSGQAGRGGTWRDVEEAGMLAGVGAQSPPAPLRGVQEASR